MLKPAIPAKAVFKTPTLSMIAVITSSTPVPLSTMPLTKLELTNDVDSDWKDALNESTEY